MDLSRGCLLNIYEKRKKEGFFSFVNKAKVEKEFY